MASLKSAPIRIMAMMLSAGVAACSPTADDPAPAPDPALIEKSSALADRFQEQLKGELSAALQSVGPVGAIGVCQSVAPAIAQDLSSESGALVQRIARRNRNPGGALPDDMASLYSQLEESPMADGAPRAVHAVRDGQLTYMRAILMQEKPCTVCHGTDIEPGLQAAIDKAYPMDKATGFKPGELRGAFVVEWPISD
jgi:hypothetical protein